jgi:hypothetical protein
MRRLDWKRTSRARECAAQFDFHSLEGTLDVSSAKQDIEQEIGVPGADAGQTGKNGIRYTA